MTSQVFVGKSRGKIVRSDCINCDRSTNHKILSDWSNIIAYGPEGIVCSRDDFQIVQCQGCNEISFRKVYSFSEDVKYDLETGEEFYDEIVKLYPSRAIGKLKIQKSDFHFLPLNVLKALNETHDAICIGSEILSGAGIRLLLEAVCQEQECKGNLKQKINQLVEKGFVVKSHAEIFHKLRDLGNESLHEIKIHTKDEIETAFIIVQNLLESVYIISKKAQRILKKGSEQ